MHSLDISPSHLCGDSCFIQTPLSQMSSITYIPPLAMNDIKTNQYGNLINTGNENCTYDDSVYESLKEMKSYHHLGHSLNPNI